MKKLRMLGGPMHGEMAPRCESPMLSIPVYDRSVDISRRPSSSFREVFYERTQLVIGTCKVPVFCVVGMSESERDRRIADIIEGVETWPQSR